MKNFICLLLCCLPAFADSIITTQLTGHFGGNADAAGCSGANICQATLYHEFRDPNNAGALYDQNGSINATASGALNTNPQAYLDVAQSRTVIPVPVGSYLLGASLETNDASHPGAGVPYASPFATATVAFNIPDNAGDVQMRVFANSFSTDPYGSGNLRIITPESGVYGYVLHFGCNPYSYTCSSPQWVGPMYAPEFDMTVLHTPGTTGAITFYAYSSTTFQETNTDQFQAIITPTPEPATFGMLFGSLVLGVLVAGCRATTHGLIRFMGRYTPHHRAE